MTQNIRLQRYSIKDIVLLEKQGYPKEFDEIFEEAHIAIADAVRSLSVNHEILDLCEKLLVSNTTYSDHAIILLGIVMDFLKNRFSYHGFYGTKAVLLDSEDYDALFYYAQNVEEIQKVVTIHCLKYLLSNDKLNPRLKHLKKYYEDLHSTLQKKLQTIVSNSLSQPTYEFSKFHYQELSSKLIPILQEKLPKSNIAKEVIDNFERLLILDPTVITEKEVSYVNSFYAYQAKKEKVSGSLADIFEKFRTEVLLIPSSKIYSSERIKTALFALLPLLLLVVIKVTPIADFLATEESFYMVLIFGALVTSVFGLIVGGLLGFFICGFIGIIAFNILTPIITLLYMPALIILSIVILLYAFRSNSGAQTKKENYMAEHKITEQMEDIRSYVNKMKSLIHKIDNSLQTKDILDYYDMILNNLEFYKKHYF